jgi:hypothetical protein
MPASTAAACTSDTRSPLAVVGAGGAPIRERSSTRRAASACSWAARCSTAETSRSSSRRSPPVRAGTPASSSATAASASANASPDGQRSSGSFARQRSIAAARPAGTSGARVRSGAAASVACLTSTAGDRRALERVLAGEQPVADDAERVQVAATVERAPEDLLGAHERRGPDHVVVAGQPRRLGLERDPEVGDQHAARRALDEDVLRLDVAVHDPVRVRVGQRPRGLAEQPHDLTRRRPAATLDPFGQRLAVDVRHREIRERAGLVGVQRRHDVRVRQLRRRPRLAEEPLAVRGVGGPRARQHLDRHRPLEPEVAREQHDAHAAAAELAFDRVLAAEDRRQLGELRVVEARAGLGRCGGEAHQPDAIRPTPPVAVGSTSVRPTSCAHRGCHQIAAPSLSTTRLYRTRGLAASPPSCRRVLGHDDDKARSGDRRRPCARPVEPGGRTCGLIR